MAINTKIFNNNCLSLNYSCDKKFYINQHGVKTNSLYEYKNKGQKNFKA